MAVIIMRNYAIPVAVMGMMFALALLCGGALVWQSVAAGPEPTPAQERLVQVAAGTAKVALGALLGFVAGVGLAARRNGR